MYIINGYLRQRSSAIMTELKLLTILQKFLCSLFWITRLPVCFKQQFSCLKQQWNSFDFVLIEYISTKTRIDREVSFGDSSRQSQYKQTASSDLEVSDHNFFATWLVPLQLRYASLSSYCGAILIPLQWDIIGLCVSERNYSRYKKWRKVKSWNWKNHSKSWWISRWYWR